MLKTTDEIHFVDFKFIITELKLKKDTNTLRIAKLNWSLKTIVMTFDRLFSPIFQARILPTFTI